MTPTDLPEFELCPDCGLGVNCKCDALKIDSHPPPEPEQQCPVCHDYQRGITQLEAEIEPLRSQLASAMGKQNAQDAEIRRLTIKIDRFLEDIEKLEQQNAKLVKACEAAIPELIGITYGVSIMSALRARQIEVVVEQLKAALAKEK